MNTEPNQRIGLIGLGNAGGALLRALSVHSPVIVQDREPARFDELAPECRHAPVWADDAAQLARQADLVIFSLPTSGASLSVAQEIAGSVSANTTVVESSTVAPGDVEALHDLLSPSGVRVIDAPLVGGVEKLSQGQATFLIGAREDDAGVAGEVFAGISEEIFYLGERGGGMRAKLIVNGVAHALYVVLMEAGALAASQDVPLDILQQLLARESGLLRPLTHRFGERLRDHDFAGGMSTANALKDSALILETARELDVPLYAMPAAHKVFELAMVEGLGGQDYASLGTLWEKWLGITLRRDSPD